MGCVHQGFSILGLALALFSVALAQEPLCADTCCLVGDGSCRGVKNLVSSNPDVYEWAAPEGFCLFWSGSTNDCQVLDQTVDRAYCESLGPNHKPCDPVTMPETAAATTAAPTAAETAFCDLPREGLDNYPCTKEWSNAAEQTNYDENKQAQIDFSYLESISPTSNQTLMAALAILRTEADCLTRYFSPTHHVCYSRDSIPALGECSDSGIRAKLDIIDGLISDIDTVAALPTVSGRLQPFYPTWWADTATCRNRMELYFGTAAPTTAPTALPSASSTQSALEVAIEKCENEGSMFTHYVASGSVFVPVGSGTCYGGCLVLVVPTTGLPIGCYLNLSPDVCVSPVIFAPDTTLVCPALPTDAPTIVPTAKATDVATTAPYTDPESAAPTDKQSDPSTTRPLTVAPTTSPETNRPTFQATNAPTTRVPTGSPTLPFIPTCTSDVYLNQAPIGQYWKTSSSATDLASCCTECETAGVDARGVKHCSVWQWDGTSCVMRKVFWKWAAGSGNPGTGYTVGIVQNPVGCVADLVANSYPGSRAEGAIAVIRDNTGAVKNELNHRNNYDAERCCMKCYHWGTGWGQHCIGFRHAVTFVSTAGDGEIFTDRCAGLEVVAEWDRPTEGTWTSYGFS